MMFERIFQYLAAVAAFMFVLAYAAVFFLAMSALWGWYPVALLNCLLLSAIVISSRQYYRRVLTRKIAVSSWERWYAIYIVALAAIAVTFNAIFVSMHLLGIYVPPFNLGKLP